MLCQLVCFELVEMSVERQKQFMSLLIRIVDDDGREYGPIDRTQLRLWCSEGRISDDHSLYCADTGQRFLLTDILDADELEHSGAFGVFANGRVSVVVGDITRQRVDAVVNAANAMLLGGSGVDGAIHRAGGPAILEECKAVRKSYPAGLPTGEAIVTTAGKMAASCVIHTVGPVYEKDIVNAPALLMSCYTRSLQLAAARKLSSIAFPAISTGVYGYPPEKASRVSSQAVKTFLVEHGDLTEIRFVFSSKNDATIFLDNQVFGSA